MDRRSFLTGLASSLPVAAIAGPPTTAVLPLLRNPAVILRLSESASRLLNPELADVTGYVLFDAKNGKLLDSYQPDLALPPASVSKAITAVYARETLGGDYRFRTRLMSTGQISNGVLQGDLYLVGGGDPALDTDELASLAQALNAKGVREISGQFYVDGSALPAIDEIDPSQPDYLGYNPAICGLNLNFNRVYFEWRQQEQGYKLTLDARGERYRPLVRWMDIDAVNRQAPVYTYNENSGHDHWTVARSALGKEGGRWLPVRQPTDYVGEVFTTLANAAGVKLPTHRHKRAPSGAVEIAGFQSEHLNEVLRWMLKYSNNLTAECLGLMASKKLGANPASLQDSASYMSRWASANLDGGTAKFVNHSGLSDKSRVSTLDMVTMLASPRSQRNLAGLLKPVNLMDNNGNSVTNSATQYVAKTGTLNFTRGLAGYLEGANKKLCFAIFAADLKARRAIPMAERERPTGARTWSGKAKRQEQALLYHWMQRFG